MLTETQAENFRHNGFLALGSFGDPDEIGWIGDLCDDAFSERFGHAPSDLNGKVPDQTPGPLMTIVSPEAKRPRLSEAKAVRETKEAVAQLFDTTTDRILLGWRLFVKPPGGVGTPWHQDAAYRPPPHKGATVWMPLDQPDGPSTSMRFIPGSHQQPVQPHDYVHGHMIAKNVDESAARTNPVGLGEASLHHCLVLHSALPNTTTLTRRAVAMVCQVDG
ncbi:MAG: phytanoyl-CoA dioxygenase family protein [Pseudomonadota bacterium]